jgi:ribosomal protein S18 acetylase RimI-like enzyme
MPSLYAEYIKERLNRSIVEDDKGFATYEFLGDHCYVVDIYVKSEFRKSGVGSQYLKIIEKIASDHGYSKLLGSVKPSAKGSNDAIKAHLAYGFNILSSTDDAIFFEKTVTI